MNTDNNKVRIDKWLWAARFFKTRSMAKSAIEGGKVHVNGQRIKSSKEVDVGLILTIRLGWDEREIEILALSDQRRGDPEDQRLYQETAKSLQQRSLKAEQRKAAGRIDAAPIQKPNTKQRRQLQQLKRDILG